MKIKLLILAFLLAIVSPVLAQDTITGVVNRIAAPFFEQNVCDTRFAIVSEDNTYYVMVDDYWPNPYLEDLIIHYDTILVGTDISVVGNIIAMEDGNGSSFDIIDIQQLVNAENAFFYSNIHWLGGFFPIAFPGPDPMIAFAIVSIYDESRCFVVIDGNLQTNYNWVVNGITLNTSIQYLLVGSYETWTDYYGEPFAVFNLKKAIPYGIASDKIEGTLTLDDGLHLNDPCLSVFNETNNYYLTIKESMLHSFINPNLYGEGTPVSINGIELTRYNLYGDTFPSFEIAVLQSQEEKTLPGVLQDAPMPNVGTTPVPGMAMAFYSGDDHYYLDNWILDFPEEHLYAVIIGNDTIPCCGTELTSTFTSTMRINNDFEPYYSILISEATVTTGLSELHPNEIRIYPNPSNGVLEIISEQPMKSIAVYDHTGKLMLNRLCHSHIDTLYLKKYKGLVLICIALQDGRNIIEKEVIR